jgi:hypothetical protein
VKLVLIEWEDSFGCSSRWQALEAAQSAKPLLCQSVGWLVHDGKECKVLVPHLTTEHQNAGRQGCGDMTIPVRSIVKIKTLRARRAA